MRNLLSISQTIIISRKITEKGFAGGNFYGNRPNNFNYNLILILVNKWMINTNVNICIKYKPMQTKCKNLFNGYVHLLNTV